MVSRSWATTVTAWWPKKRVCSEILHRAAKFVESDLAIIILVNLVAEKWWKLIARDDPILVLVMSIEDILRSTETSAWTILSRRSFIKRGIVVGANQPVVEKAHLGRHFSAREVGRKSGQSCHVLPGYPILSRCFDQIEK